MLHSYGCARDFLLTYDSKIITETACRCIPEVDSAAVNTLVVQPDILHHKLRRLGYCAEVRPGAKHFRCWPMPGLAQRFASDVETADKTTWQFQEVCLLKSLGKRNQVREGSAFSCATGGKKSVQRWYYTKINILIVVNIFGHRKPKVLLHILSKTLYQLSVTKTDKIND